MAKRKAVRVVKRQLTWEEAMEQFILWKQAQGMAPRTIEDYRFHVGLLFRRHPGSWPDEVKDAIIEHMAEPVKPATFNIRRKYLKAFFEWCVDEELISENPLARIKKRKDEGRVVNHDTELMSKLISMPNKNTFSGLRDHALMLLSLDTGIRPGEAFSLLPSDVNLRSLEIYVRGDAAKTRVARTLPIMPVTAKAIRQLIDSRHPDWKDNVPLFCTFEGNKLNRNRWNSRIKMYCNKLNEDGFIVNPYDLRHTFALEFLRNGGHTLALQRIMGHTSLDMTKRYVALTQADLKEQHGIASPLQKLLPDKHRVRNIGRMR